MVGESGSGKSVTNLSILGLNDNANVSGEILFCGQDLLKFSNKELQKIRGNKIAMIFQDPMTSLNPFLKIFDQIMEPLIMHKGMSKIEAKQRSIELLDMVGIKNPQKYFGHYPHHFSGGMRQRVMVAMSLTCDPELLIADEATTALDVTIQAQILELIQDLKRKLNMSVILVTHNLGIVAGMADRVFVMYNGCIVEKGTVDEIFYNTQHPYTKGLIRSIPRLDQDKNERLYVMSDKDKEKRKDDNSRLGKHVSKGFFMQAWCKVIKNRMFVCTFGIFIVYLLVIFFANFLPIHSYTDQHSVHLNLRPSFQKSGTIVYNREKKLLENMANRQKRSLTSEDHQKLEILKSDLEKDVINERVYILGTDGLGRDMLSRLIYASRVSILVGVVGAVISVLIGILAGSISGYIGGRLDRFIMASIEILSSLPYMLLVIILMTIFRDHILNIFIAIALISWLVEARLVRGQILSLKNSEFIEAACSMGAGTSTIIFKHLIPNILDIVIVFVTVRIPSFILAESFLSFLGLGISAPLTSWGILIQDGVGSMELYSWQLFFPALVMGIFLFSINFVGDGLRDSFDIRENSS